MSITQAEFELQISRNAPMDQIKTKYRELSKLYHPDKCGTDVKQKRINAAYQAMKDYKNNGSKTYNAQDTYSNQGNQEKRQRPKKQKPYNRMMSFIQNFALNSLGIPPENIQKAHHKYKDDINGANDLFRKQLHKVTNSMAKEFYCENGDFDVNQIVKKGALDFFSRIGKEINKKKTKEKIIDYVSIILGQEINEEDDKQNAKKTSTKRNKPKNVLFLKKDDYDKLLNNGMVTCIAKVKDGTITNDVLKTLFLLNKVKSKSGIIVMCRDTKNIIYNARRY